MNNDHYESLEKQYITDSVLVLWRKDEIAWDCSWNRSGNYILIVIDALNIKVTVYLLYNGPANYYIK